jgi:Leucine-rich repeat (LRR) protein
VAKTDFASLGKKALGKNRLENGFLHVTNHEGWNPEGPDEIWRNGAIRTTLLWEGPSKTKGPQIHIRGLGGHGSYFIRPTGRELQVLFGKTGQAERQLAKFPIEPPFKPDSEVSVRIAAIGKRLILWANGHHLGSLDDETQTRPGTPYLSAEAARFKSIEVINLDGLPETEALKMLGVEEQGRDPRQPAPAVAETATPASFPAGRWVKLLTPGSVLPEGAIWENQWIVTDGAMLPLLVRPAKASFTNAAFRATIKKEPSGGRGILAIRHQDKGGKQDFRAFQVPQVLSNPAKIDIQTSVNGTQTLQTLAQGSVDVGDGQARTMEFAAVGDRVLLRINGMTVARAKDDKPQAGEMMLSEFKGRIRDIEIINLDGLPEAEALKILGMDGEGNDLPVVVAKQEEMPKAQADVMAAIPELKALHEQFLKLQAERVTAPFEADVAKLNTGYLGGLDRRIGEMKQKGDLDSVLALEAEKALVAGKQPVPLGDEKTLLALKDLRQIYWDAHGKLEANRAANLKLLTDPLDMRLQQLETALTQQNQIENAKAVREYREVLIREERSDIASGPAKPAANASNGGAAATVTEAAKSALAPLKNLPPGDDRKAAEWALDMGGEVFVLEVRDRRRIQAKADLPKRSFDLVSVSIDSERSTKPVIPFTGLSALAGLKHLSFLELRGYPVRDDDTDYLATLPNLTHLQITDCKTFSGKKLSMLKKAEKLEILNLRSTDKVSADGIAQIGQLSELKNLNLSASKLADSDLPPLRQLKKLEGLSVTGPEITLAGWRELKGLPLKSCGFSSPPGKFAEWCREIGSLFPTINHSYMWSGQPFPAGEIAALKGFGGLEELIISSVHTDDATLAEVLDFPKLNKLVINNGGSADLAKKVTDEGIAQLAKLRSLKTLRLENLGEVTGEGLIGLRQLENLELPLRSCPKFKEAAFRNARPDVKISR